MSDIEISSVEEDTNDSVQETRRSRRRKYLFAAFVVAIIAAGAVLFLLYRDKATVILSSIVTKVQKLNVAGDVIIFLILTAACFPPVFIYAIFAIMGGFVYGFPFGFLLVVTASTLGSITCFMLSRSLLRDHFNRLASRYTFLLRANQVIDKKGFWILLIVRLGPYPFSIVSVLAAQTSISTWKFALATFLSTPRFLAFVYIGSTLTSLLESGDPSKSDNIASLIALIAGIVVGVLGALWCGWIIRREVVKFEQTQSDEVNLEDEDKVV